VDFYPGSSYARSLSPELTTGGRSSATFSPNSTFQFRLEVEAGRAIETVDPTVRSVTLRAMALLPHTRARGESRRLLQTARQSANAIEEPHGHAMEIAEIAGDLARLDDGPETIITARALLMEAIVSMLAESAWDRASPSFAVFRMASIR
jgi:hypothetical protein